LEELASDAAHVEMCIKRFPESEMLVGRLNQVQLEARAQVAAYLREIGHTECAEAFEKVGL